MGLCDVTHSNMHDSSGPQLQKSQMLLELGQEELMLAAWGQLGCWEQHLRLHSHLCWGDKTGRLGFAAQQM